MRISIKNISPIAVVGIMLTIVCFGIFVLAPPFIGDVSNKVYDQFLKRTAQEPKSDSIIMVDIDEASLEYVGQWPWPRYLLAALTEAILADNASVIAFDVVFPEKDGKSPSLVKEELNKRFNLDVKFEGLPDDLSNFDEMFAQALKSGKTVLGCYMQKSEQVMDVDVKAIHPGYSQHIIAHKGTKGNANYNDFIFQAQDMTVSIPELSSASSSAFFNAEPDSDNIVRNNPLVWSLGADRIYPSMALEVLRLHLGAPNCIVKYDEMLGVQEIVAPPVRIPTDQAGRMQVNYRKVTEDVRRGCSFSFPMCSASNVLTGAFPAGTFSNKIVFVGTSAAGLKDLKATPLCSSFPGVEVHATIVDNALSGDMLRLPQWSLLAHSMAIVLTGVFLTILISRARSWVAFLASMGLIFLAIGCGLFAISKYHIVFVPAWEILSVAIIYPVLTMIKFWQEEVQKKQVRDMFGTMVSTEVLHYLEHNPGSFSLTGQRAEATMFFSDVKGFTTISESLPPDKLSVLLNRYLSPMTEIIMEHRGYVDKYEGDLIMAVWGVPYAMKDHAVQACLAALEQQEKLAQIRQALRQQFGHDIYVRMGINSGIVTAGNMGSDKKFQYTVMGDAVNQASRFEPTNKDYGTSIIIGETTYEEAKEHIEARLLDKIIVQGKTKPIQIYELLARKERLVPAMLKVIRLYDKALRLHWERKWNEALECLDVALGLDSQDGPSAKLRARILAYKETPPPDGWIGEYARATKD